MQLLVQSSYLSAYYEISEKVTILDLKQQYDINILVSKHYCSLSRVVFHLRLKNNTQVRRGGGVSVCHVDVLCPND